MSDLELLERRLKRERVARKAAENLLEQKSLEVYQANQKLLDLAEQNQAIVETAAEGIVTYDQDGAILSFNRSAQKIFRRERAIGTDIRDLFELTESNATSLFRCAVESAATDLTEDGEPLIPEPTELIGIRAGNQTFTSEVTVSCTTRDDRVTHIALVRDLSRRKKLEARLSQAQKMESIGQLAAGIAHEINTPIQFVGNNIQFLQGAFDDLGALLASFEELVDRVKQNQPADDLINQIDEQRELADLPFLREEFPDAIKQSMDGIDRVATIVRAMKEFSQPVSDNKTSVDLHRAIEGALSVSIGQYRDIAKIETSFDANGRSVVCLGAQLNQVILNVIANACEAIEEHHDAGEGRIRISTHFNDDAVEMRFEDNGPGIPAEILDRIFDPFFTTKEVGKGTGQGLAFVYDVIVNKHEGTIHAQSPPGGGTTLVISIPIGATSNSTRPQHANSLS